MCCTSAAEPLSLPLCPALHIISSGDKRGGREEERREGKREGRERERKRGERGKEVGRE